MTGDEPWTELFIRFKNQVDDHIANVFHNTLGVPSVVSRDMNSDWTSTPQTRQDSRPGGGGEPVTPQPRSAHTGLDRLGEMFASTSPTRSLLDAELFTESLYQVIWLSFLVDSPYSPLRLQDIPQPVPRDLPKNGDPSLFGFEDAFEDLLLVTSGQGLSDIQCRYRLKEEWREHYPQGLPPILWLHQLCRQGLWDGWEARPDVSQKLAGERWRRWLEKQGEPFRQASAMQGDRSSSARLGPPCDTRDGNDSTTQLKTESAPDAEQVEVEENAYNTFAGGMRVDMVQNPWERTRRALFGSTDGQSELGDHRAIATATENLPKGWKVDEVVRERVLPNGHTSVTTTRTTFDEKGQEVGREAVTRSQFTWSTNRSDNTGEKADMEGPDKNVPEQPSERESGWFWK